MRRRTMVVGLVLSLLSAAVYAQLRDKPPAATGTYRVTRWPDHTGPDESYTQELDEEHLNKMAGDGWRFHSDVVGQNVKMMVFERVTGR